MLDHITPPRLQALHKEWNKHPPIHILAAAWMGYKPKEREAPIKGKELHDFMSSNFPAGRA